MAAGEPSAPRIDRQRYAPPRPSEAVASWQDAVEDAPGGARLLLDVTPAAREPRFPDGFDPWRGRLGIRVAAPPEGGKANADVVRALAAFFRHPTARIHVEAGALDRRKSVRLMGLARADVLAALSPAFPEAR